MWFQIDEQALDDTRIRLLGAHLHLSFGEAFLACCRVWCWLYKQCGRDMTTEEVDVVSGHSGFAEAMERNQLAEFTPDGIRIRGDKRAKAYGAFCIRQRDLVKRRYGKDPVTGVAITNELPPVEPGELPKAGLRVSLDLDLDLPDSGSGKSSPRAIAKARQAEKAEQAKVATEAWLEWFNRSFARSFRVTQALTKQVGAILAQGHTERPDMRGVALYLGMRWEGQAEMVPFLVPPSILRPSKFEERLELAREWDRTVNGQKIWGSP